MPRSSRKRITPVGGVEAERAAARQHDRVHELRVGCGGLEQVGLARAGRAAAHVDARHRARSRQHDRAAGRPLGERVVPDLDPGDRGEPDGRAIHGR